MPAEWVLDDPPKKKKRKKPKQTEPIRRRNWKGLSHGDLCQTARPDPYAGDKFKFDHYYNDGVQEYVCIIDLSNGGVRSVFPDRIRNANGRSLDD